MDESKGLKKVIDTLLLKKYGLTCDVYADKVGFHNVVVNANFSDLIVELGGKEGLYSYLLNGKSGGFSYNTQEVGKYVNLVPFDIDATVIISANDEDKVFELNSLLTDALMYAAEEFGSDCFLSIEIDKNGELFREYKPIDWDYESTEDKKLYILKPIPINVYMKDECMHIYTRRVLEYLEKNINFVSNSRINGIYE